MEFAPQVGSHVHRDRAPLSPNSESTNARPVFFHFFLLEAQEWFDGEKKLKGTGHDLSSQSTQSTRVGTGEEEEAFLNPVDAHSDYSVVSAALEQVRKSFARFG